MGACVAKIFALFPGLRDGDADDGRAPSWAGMGRLRVRHAQHGRRWCIRTSTGRWSARRTAPETRRNMVIGDPGRLEPQRT